MSKHGGRAKRLASERKAGGRRTILVDGANLMFYLADSGGQVERYRGAGQPEVLADRARAFAQDWDSAGFDLLIVYDGPGDAVAKMRTASDRFQRRFTKNIEASTAIALRGCEPDDPGAHLPIGASATVMEALRRCGNVGLFGDFAEADGTLAACAAAYADGASPISAAELRSAAAPGPAAPSAPAFGVLGDDSDFFIFGCRYIHLKHTQNGVFTRTYSERTGRTSIDAVVHTAFALHYRYVCSVYFDSIMTHICAYFTRMFYQTLPGLASRPHRALGGKPQCSPVSLGMISLRATALFCARCTSLWGASRKCTALPLRASTGIPWILSCRKTKMMDSSILVDIELSARLRINLWMRRGSEFLNRRHCVIGACAKGRASRLR